MSVLPTGIFVLTILLFLVVQSPLGKMMRPHQAELDEAAVLNQLSGRLAKYKQPKRVIFVDALPRNTMGKVVKPSLVPLFRNSAG